jgi:hypothetical protein
LRGTARSPPVTLVSLGFFLAGLFFTAGFKYQANGEGGEASDEVVPAPLGSNIRYVHGWPRDPVVH